MNECDPRLTVRLCTDPTIWDPFVDRVPGSTAQHTFGFGQALESCFKFLRQRYHLILWDENVVAALPMMQFSVCGWLQAIQCLPFRMYGAPLIDPAHAEDEALIAELVAQIDAEARSARAFEVSISFPPHTPRQTIDRLEARGPSVTYRRDCPMLALNQPLDDIVAHYKPSVRRNIARSHREGVIVEEDIDLEKLRQAYPLYLARMRVLGASAKPWRFVEAIWRQGLIAGFIARRNGHNLGFLTLLVARHFALYWLSATDPAMSHVRPMNALLDAAIRWCHARGIRWFSLGESHGGRPGLVRFKTGWSPQPAHSVEIVRCYRPRIQNIWRAIEPTARRAYATWERPRWREHG